MGSVVLSRSLRPCPAPGQRDTELGSSTAACGHQRAAERWKPARQRAYPSPPKTRHRAKVNISSVHCTNTLAPRKWHTSCQNNRAYRFRCCAGNCLRLFVKRNIILDLLRSHGDLRQETWIGGGKKKQRKANKSSNNWGGWHSSHSQRLTGRFWKMWFMEKWFCSPRHSSEVSWRGFCTSEGMLAGNNVINLK